MSYRSMSSWMTIAVSTCALLAFQGTPVCAQPGGDAVGAAQKILAASPDSALTVALAQLPGEGLRLSDAVAQASVAATGARVAGARLEAANQSLRSEKGAFDPELFGSADWSGTDTPSASLFAGADVVESTNSVFEAGARVRLSLGTELSASLNSQRLSTNSAFASLNPEYQAFGALAIRQPLLRGFGPAARSGLRFAEHSRDAAAARYEGALDGVRAEVEILYWELYAAERNHAVALIIRDRAEAFLTDTTLRAKAGVIGPSQVANADFFLTEAEQTLLETEEQLDLYSDRLASLMGRRPHGVRYRAGDEPPRDFRLVDQDSLVAQGLQHNPEIAALRRDISAQNALEHGARWDARPTLDILGGLGGNGLSGRAQDVFFPGDPTPVRAQIDGGRGDSLGDVVGRDYPTWNVGFVFAVPLGNRQGKSERERIRAEVVRGGQELLAAQRLLEEQIRAQYRELRRGNQRLSLALRGAEASIRQVEIGLLEYRNGRSTAFEVVRLAADLATAQQRYSAALVRTARAAAALRQLTGGWYSGAAMPINSAKEESGS